jgi:hypothetical protein
LFNLEEFMNNEFLRPRENICKWFNTFGVMWMWEYIEKEEKCKFLFRNNYLNRFIKSLNQSRQFKTRLEKRKMIWWLIRILQALNRFKITQDEDWYDSKYFESIQHKSERFCDMIQPILSRFKSESIQIFMKWFTQS